MTLSGVSQELAGRSAEAVERRDGPRLPVVYFGQLGSRACSKEAAAMTDPFLRKVGVSNVEEAMAGNRTLADWEYSLWLASCALRT